MLRTFFKSSIAGIGFLVGIGVALAASITTFGPGQQLSSTAMNENFAGLDARLRKVEDKIPAQCGLTGVTLGRVSDGLGAVGYPAIKSLCVRACGTPTAHGCRAEEVVQIAENGGAISTGWYASAVWSGTDGSGSNDCAAWTSTDSSLNGPFWTADGKPGALDCDDSAAGGRKFICCD